MKRESTTQLSFGDMQVKRRKVKSKFFEQINAVIDWRPLRQLIEPAYGKGFSVPKASKSCKRLCSTPLFSV